MAILGMIKSIIRGRQIPGSPGIDCVAASVTTYTEPIILYVTVAGTFNVTPISGTPVTGLALPVGVFPVYLQSIESLGAGAGVAIYQ